MKTTPSHEHEAAGSRPIRVLAVDDEQGRVETYIAALRDAPGIEYRGLKDHPEAFAGPTEEWSWLDYDVVLLDLGVTPNISDDSGPPMRNPRRLDDVDMFAGFNVAKRIHELHPTGQRPFIALVTGYFRDPGVRERAARLKVVDGFYERSVYDRDDGENLRKLVYAAAKGEVWIEGADEIPEPTHDEKEELKKLLDGRLVTEGDKTDVHKALEDGIAKMQRLGLSMEEYLDKSKKWSQSEARRVINPVTKAVAEHFAVQRGEDGRRGRYEIERQNVRKLFRRRYWPDES